MSVENKVPALRFKGFSGEWDNCVLGENARFAKGQGYSKGDLVTSGSPIILYGRLYTKYQTIIDGIDTFVTEKTKSIKSIGGEVIVPASGESPEDISRASVVSAPNIILGGDLNVIYPNKKINSNFLALSISNGRLKKELSAKAQGKSVVHIRNSDLADLSLILPNTFSEQIAIGNYFQTLDRLINQHQQQHDQLCHIKKAMLEKMFPKAGETVPEIRFKGFSGEWDEIQLNKEVTFINGRAYSQEELKDKGKYPVLRVGNFYTNFSWYYSDMELGDKYYANSGDLLYTWSASFGPHIWSGGKVIYHYHIWKLEHSDNIDKLFLLHLLDYDREKILSGSNGSTMIHITKSAMELKKVFIPKKEEQTAIGNYFQTLDTLIKQHQQQLSKLHHIKQACLNNMFV